MDSIMWLERLGRRDTEVAGGKGANLGELIAAGFRVPAGFVVTAEAYLSSMAAADVRRALAEPPSSGAADDEALASPRRKSCRTS